MLFLHMPVDDQFRLFSVRVHTDYLIMVNNCQRMAQNTTFFKIFQ